METIFATTGNGKRLATRGDNTYAEVAYVVGDGDLVTVTPTLDTNVYAGGDLVFDLTAIAGAVREIGDIGYLKSLTIIDKNAQGTALDIYVAQGSASFGTLNSAPNISAANIAANQVQLLTSFLASDYKTLSGARIATRQDLALEIKAAWGTRDYYIAAVAQSGQTPTYTAGGLVLLVGVMWR